MKYLLAIALIFTACKQDPERRTEFINQDVFTIRHEGLCFVVYDDSAGVAMVQVNCDELAVEETQP